MRLEPEEGIEKVQEALKMCQCYVQCYHDHRNGLFKYFKEKPVIEWSFQSTLVFVRLDKFVQQLQIIEVI